MKLILGSVFLSLVLCPLLGKEFWEPIFPNDYPLVEDMDLLSIAVRAMEDGRLEHLIGSSNGKVLYNYDFNGSNNWEITQFGIPFDITALCFANSSYFLGGPNGQIARSALVLNDDPLFLLDALALTQLWTVSPLPTDEPIRLIDSLGGAILVLAGEFLIASFDGCNTWESLDQFNEILSIRVFEDSAYCLERNNENNTTTLWKSMDAMEWTEEWEVEQVGPPIYLTTANLFTLSDAYDKSNRPSLADERLFAILDGWGGSPQGPGTHYELLLSIGKQGPWFDHGSTRTFVVKEWSSGGGRYPPYYNTRVRSRDPWNPLGLPDERIGFRPPGRRSGKISGNYRVEENLLEAYSNSEWVSQFTTDSSPKIRPSLIAADEILTYIYQDAEVVIHLPDGSIDTISIPNSLTGPTVSWTGWINLGSQYFGLAGDVLVSTEDFNHWDSHFDVSRGGILMGGETFPSVAVASQKTIEVQYEERSVYYAIRTLKESADQDGLLYDEVLLPDDITSVAYLPQTDSFYALWINAPFQFPVEERTVVIERILKDNSTETFATFFPASWNGYFDTLVCPDGETLIAFGDSAEMAIIDTEGNVQMSHPWRLFPPDDYRISNITYADGWYYIQGGTALRTHDFIDFEQISEPVGDAIISIVGWENNLYAFSGGAVYQQNTEPGYLNSHLIARGWFESNWLGTFQIINEDKGDIEHLLLGECWVKQESDQQYWLRTSTLGWIYIYKDWSPWFWRMDDAHWYWLDQDSWPPRAWDDHVKEWIELLP